jgi:hypothetical protein
MKKKSAAEDTRKTARACCMVSELLEEAGLDRERIRAARRQILEGIILLCQWQLQRMAPNEPPRSSAGAARKVPVE